MTQVSRPPCVARRVLTALCAAMACVAAKADELKTDGQWRGSAALSASVARGNAESTQFATRFDAYRATPVDKWSLYGNALYGEQRTDAGEEKTADHLLLGARYDHDLSRRVFVFGLGELGRDRLADLSHRVTAATGFGHKLVRSESTTFDLFGGIAGTRSRYGSGTENDFELLLGEESSHRLTSAVRLTQKLTAYPSVSDRGEWRSTFDATLQVQLNARLGLQVGLQHRHSSRVPEGVDRNDTVFLTGLNLRLGAD